MRSTANSSVAAGRGTRGADQVLSLLVVARLPLSRDRQVRAEEPDRASVEICVE